MDLVPAESGHTCWCGAGAVVCDLDGEEEDGTAFYCPECFFEEQRYGGYEGRSLVNVGIVGDKWVVLRP